MDETKQDSADKKKTELSKRTRSFGRKLSRSVSIMALKLPEKAQLIRRKSSAVLKSGLRDKRRHREFDVCVIVPDKTQRQITVNSVMTVEELIMDILKQFNCTLVEDNSFGRTTYTASNQRVHLLLGDSKAPVRSRASVTGLEGEVLVIESLPSSWEYDDLSTFIAWENLYVSTLNSSIELYSKPLLRAGVITKEENHILFHYLEAVAKASTNMIERMQKYLDSGLINNNIVNSNHNHEQNVDIFDKEDNKSILSELVKEGLLTERDLAISSNMNNTKDTDETDSIVIRRDVKGRNKDDYDKTNSCCLDHRISSELNENVWANMQWDFISPIDFGYDFIPSVKRSKSEVIVSCNNDNVNGDATPYESIEDIYDCIKICDYECDKEYNDCNVSSYYESTKSDKTESIVSSSPSNYKSGSDSSNKEYSVLLERRCSSPNSVQLNEVNESVVLLRQLFCGELMDAYGEFVCSYRHARALLRHKRRNDEHFQALADIRRGVALYEIGDYLELPIERLAAYERLIGNGTCGKRYATRLSDLERVQDLFPHDHLGLHETEYPGTTQKWPQSKEQTPNRSRTFLMEAPVTLCALEGGTTLDRHLFLFSDLIIVAKSRGANRFKLKERIRLADVWISNAEHDTGFMLGWATSAGPVTYLGVYPTQAARDTWQRKIKNALSTQLESEPKTTNIQVIYKDTVTSVECCKTLAATPDMTTGCIIRGTLASLRNNNNDTDTDTEYGNIDPNDYVLWVRLTRHAPPMRLHGIERVHAIQMCRIRQTLSNEEGFDLEHVNARHNPCGLVFELRKKSNNNISKSLSRVSIGGRLWGLPLESVCTGSSLPPALLLILRPLRMLAPRTHGVFRRSPSLRALKILKEELDRLGPKTTNCPGIENATALLLAALLKDYLRSLPEPLLTTALYSQWIRLIDADMPESGRVEGARALIRRLPGCHVMLLSHTICVLEAVARHARVTEMCAANLGVCVGPSLLWPAPSNVPSAPSGPAAVARLLIAHADALFGPRCSALLGADSPDSGAEESDSLHSLGASLDSAGPRREPLSLSRDSGLTLSEDDSMGSPARAPRPTRVYLTGLEPPKPPRIERQENIYGSPEHIYGVTENVYGINDNVYATANRNHNNPLAFSRAKSSDNLLADRQRSRKTNDETYGCTRQNQDIYGEKNNTSYSRVYPERENRNSTYEYVTNVANLGSYMESVYGTGRPKSNDNSGKDTFTRKDWTRRAARTKSLETGEDIYSSTEILNSPPQYDIYSTKRMNKSDTCLHRMLDPAHLCSNKCSQVSVNKVNNDQKLNEHATYAMPIKNNKYDKNLQKNSLTHSKSLANIVQSDSSSSDTLYQRQSASLRSTDSPASENSLDNHFVNQYDALYTPIYNNRHDLKKQNGFLSDIYTAKLTSVEPENYYGEIQKDIKKKLPPPVPPRNVMYHNTTLKRFPPVHIDKTRTERNGYNTARHLPNYREPPSTNNIPQKSKSHNNMIALNNSDTDTESESYV